MRELKKHTDNSALVKKMTERGLEISNPQEVELALENINYYRISGYLHAFKQPGTDRYVDGLTWERISRIYDFDRKISRVLMYALENIEETLKTRISYSLTASHQDDPLIYLKPNIYRDYHTYVSFLDHFYKEKENNKNLPFVKHHNEFYGGFLPAWVAVELLTMGNIHSIYDNLESVYQKQLAKKYNTGPRQLSSWIENLTYTRNHLAHYMRVYNYNFGRSPVKCKNHPAYTGQSNMIFDQVYIIACMYSDVNDWNNYVITELKAILEEYSDAIELDGLGFPENWEAILKR